jgi:multiple sugar transport system permease protein
VVTRTGVYVFSSVFFHIFIALCLAVFLDRKKGLAGRWARTVRSVLIVPWLISWAVAAAVWRLILRPSGVLNAYLMRLGIIESQIPWLGSLDFAMAWVVAITVWKAFPFFLMMTYAALQTVPNQLYESAQIDGAGVFGQFRHVTLPGIMPTLLTLTVLDIIWSLRQFDVLFLTTGGGPLRSTRTLTLQVYMTAFEGLRFGLASAQGVLIMLLSTIMSVVYLFLYSRAEKNL